MGVVWLGLCAKRVAPATTKLMEENVMESLEEWVKKEAKEILNSEAMKKLRKL